MYLTDIIYFPVKGARLPEKLLKIWWFRWISEVNKSEKKIPTERTNFNFFLHSGPKVPLPLPAPGRKCCIFGLARQQNRIRTTGANKECLRSHVVYWPCTRRKTAEIRLSSSSRRDTSFFIRAPRYVVLRPCAEICLPLSRRYNRSIWIVVDSVLLK